jgi:choline dehydrogenase-like flavoprotein
MERDIPAGGTLTSDVCIAGAGAAGITLARELRSSGLDVVVLESGGINVGKRPQALYEGENIGIPYPALDTCRMRVLGGTTIQWAGMCRPLDKEDFEKRDWIPDSGWPITLDDLIPYYKQAQEDCEIGNFDYDSRALSRRLNLQSFALDSPFIDNVALQMSPPTRFGEKYRRELKQASDLRVILGANLVEIVQSESGDHISSFRCATFSGRKFEVRARRFVLALGGIENVRLLLASNRQNPAGVANASGAVGRYFLEHPHYLPGAYLISKGIGDLRLYQQFHEVDTRDEETQTLRRASTLFGISLTEATRVREKLMRVSCFIITRSMFGSEQPLSSVSAQEIQALLSRGSGEAQLLQLNIRAEQTPLADSRVTLSTEKDELGVPRSQLDWRIRPQDGHDIRRTLELIAGELGRKGLGRIWIPHDGLEFTAEHHWGFHHMGTTRMGDSAQDSVVDANCRSHDADNLYIAGSSVFRTGGFANPTLTIIALARRLGAHLKDLS